MNWDPVTERKSERERPSERHPSSEFVCVCGKSTVGPKDLHFFGVRFSQENPKDEADTAIGGWVMSNR